MMDKFISRWAKKPLAQVVSIFTGIIILVYWGNMFFPIVITDKFFVSVSYNVSSLISKNGMWTLTLFLYMVLFLYEFFEKKYIQAVLSVEKITDERKNKVLSISFTIIDLIALLASILGLFSVLMIHNCIATNSPITNNFLVAIVYLCSFFSFCRTVYYHFYFHNLSLLKSMKR